ncbi:MAG: sigma 54-interacting transcriptional regulator, partial [Bacteroidota bacterium]
MTIQQIKQRYGIIGNCREINTAVEIAMQVAPTEVTVLVYGENGTGKDVFSRIIHDNSWRKHKSLIA